MKAAMHRHGTERDPRGYDPPSLPRALQHLSRLSNDPPRFPDVFLAVLCGLVRGINELSRLLRG